VGDVFPFIVGCARSGTTLLRAMFDAHSEIAIPGESYFAVWLGRRRGRYETPDGFDTERFLGDLLPDHWFRHWGVADADVRAALDAASPATFPDAVRAVYRCYAVTHGKTRYGDKTPTYVRYIPVLARDFPESVFVHLVRDGRDVALSLLDAPWGPQTFADAALHWRDNVAAGRRAGRALGVARYCEVRYEDLLADPEREARMLCRFMGIAYEPAMLAYAERADEMISRLPDPREHANLRLPPTVGLRDWRRTMPEAQVQLFDALAGPALRQFGYEPGPAPPDGDTRVKAAYARARWRARNGARRARRVAVRARDATGGRDVR
jgi:hypothetical protein